MSKPQRAHCQCPRWMWMWMGMWMSGSLAARVPNSVALAGWEPIGIFVQRNAGFSRTTLMHRRLISIGKVVASGREGGWDGLRWVGMGGGYYT